MGKRHSLLINLQNQLPHRRFDLGHSFFQKVVEAGDSSAPL